GFEEDVAMDPPLSSQQQILDPTRKWLKKWVPQETTLKSGKCYFLKWVNEDAAKALEERSQPQKVEPVVEPVVEPEYEVAFLCSTENCGQIFTEAAAMRKHAQSHVQFICEYEGCGRKFPDSSKLKRHQLTDTGERHFVSPSEGCGKPQMQRLFPSVKVATAPVERESVNTRIITPTLDRPYSCPHNGCEKVYKHEYKLNLHLKREHAGTAFEDNGKQVKKIIEEKVMYEGDEQYEDTREIGIRGGYGRRKFPTISNSSPASNTKRGAEQDDAREVGVKSGYGRAKFPIISKLSLASSTKIKYSNNIAVFDQNTNDNSKAHEGKNFFFAKGESEEDSEKTEDQEGIEDEGWSNKIDVETESDDDDDEETEDERS
ncbi:hypothetical protein KI387_004645, partial [Taxus chinensis]